MNNYEGAVSAIQGSEVSMAERASRKPKTKAKKKDDTNRELRKMKRAELLEMMVRQGKAVGVLREQLEQAQMRQAETEAEMQAMEETFERLRQKLDDKDEEMLVHAQQMEETLEHLKERLDQKDEELRMQAERTEVTFGRLRAKLDEKDEELQAQMQEMHETTDHLKRRLDEKDEKIRALRAELKEERENRGLPSEGDSGSIAKAALRLNHVVEDAQRTTERYLEIVQNMAQRLERLERNNGSGDTSHES